MNFEVVQKSHQQQRKIWGSVREEDEIEKLLLFCKWNKMKKYGEDLSLFMVQEVFLEEDSTEHTL